MRIFNFILAALFLIFAFVQVNDPDPILWIIIYGAMAVLAVLAMFRIYPGQVILTMIVLYVGYSLVYFRAVRQWLQSQDKFDLFDNVAKMNNLYIEESREFLGLWICIAVLIYYWIRSRRTSS